MLSRTLEPEVMDTASEAVDYDGMDHSSVNRLFVDDFLAVLGPLPTTETLQVFDAGTGTAQIPLELIRRDIRAQITASDLAEQMLIVARENVRRANRADAIRLVRSDCKQLPDATGTYDAVMSNSIVHHIPEPRAVLAELWRILKPDGLLFIRDLMRPDDTTTVERFVRTYAGDANTHQQQMFRDSLHAALTIDEVRAMLCQVGIPADGVSPTSDRHWTISVRKRPQ
ncbi:MAG: class I SAM-dependent methyltransferase [Planctomycetes bacterium]|nr:class I SAM-dependent methyltransferase [Planctomycetota bacterium]